MFLEKSFISLGISNLYVEGHDFILVFLTEFKKEEVFNLSVLFFWKEVFYLLRSTYK